MDLPVPRRPHPGHRHRRSAGRKQYLYHPRWRERRDQEKFDDMVDFARALPRAARARRRRPRAATTLVARPRARLRRAAARPRLLPHRLRGLRGRRTRPTGWRRCSKRHVHASTATTLRLRLPGQARQAPRAGRSSTRRSPRSSTRLKRRRGGGDELLAYKDGRPLGRRALADINAYLKDATGARRLAPRTSAPGARPCWRRSRSPSRARRAGTKTARKRAITRAVKEVAYYLGNTPAVARASYIDPRVFDRYRDGVTIAVRCPSSPTRTSTAIQGAVEEAVLDLVTGERLAARWRPRRGGRSPPRRRRGVLVERRDGLVARRRGSGRSGPGR